MDPEGEGEVLMALDDAMGELMRRGPTVELYENELSLVANGSEAHFVERPEDGTEATGGGSDESPLEDGGSTTPPAGQDAEPSDPLIPSSADSVDVDLREWMGNSGPLVLTAVEVGGVVHAAVDTPMGGSVDGGPLSLHARFGEDALELRACQAVPLTLGESAGRPTIGLPSPGSFSTEGCDAAAGDQVGQVLKIISLGPVTRTVETPDGRYLVIESDEGSAAFRWPL
jgi:hypothetical protein